MASETSAAPSGEGWSGVAARPAGLDQRQLHNLQADVRSRADYQNEQGIFTGFVLRRLGGLCHWLEVEYMPTPEFIEADQRWACQVVLRETITVPDRQELVGTRDFRLEWDTSPDTQDMVYRLRPEASDRPDCTPEVLTHLLGFFQKGEEA